MAIKGEDTGLIPVCAYFWVPQSQIVLGLMQKHMQKWTPRLWNLLIMKRNTINFIRLWRCQEKKFPFFQERSFSQAEND